MVRRGPESVQAYARARLVLHSTCVFSLPNPSPITLVSIVQVGEVAPAPAFGGASPSVSASSAPSSTDSV